MRTVVLQVPEKEPEARRSFHDSEEGRVISLNGGPAVAFTNEETRIYDSDLNEFVSLSNRELVELLADAYDINSQDTDSGMVGNES